MKILLYLRDWQAIKQGQALEAMGTPEGQAYLTESKRYAAAAEVIEKQAGLIEVCKRAMEDAKDQLRNTDSWAWEPLTKALAAIEKETTN